jgi:hypothetical protein
MINHNVSDLRHPGIEPVLPDLQNNPQPIELAGPLVTVLKTEEKKSMNGNHSYL